MLSVYSVLVAYTIKATNSMCSHSKWKVLNQFKNFVHISHGITSDIQLSLSTCSLLFAHFAMFVHHLCDFAHFLQHIWTLNVICLVCSHWWMACSAKLMTLVKLKKKMQQNYEFWTKEIKIDFQKWPLTNANINVLTRLNFKHIALNVINVIIMSSYRGFKIYPCAKART